MYRNLIVAAEAAASTVPVYSFGGANATLRQSCSDPTVILSRVLWLVLPTGRALGQLGSPLGPVYKRTAFKK